ncbi:hypothetical protein H8959_006921 [Pygathrix nigripes]
MSVCSSDLSYSSRVCLPGSRDSCSDIWQVDDCPENCCEPPCCAPSCCAPAPCLTLVCTPVSCMSSPCCQAACEPSPCQSGCTSSCTPSCCQQSSCQLACCTSSPCQQVCCMPVCYKPVCCVPTCSEDSSSCCQQSSCQPACCTSSSCQQACCMPVCCKPVCCKPICCVPICSGASSLCCQQSSCQPACCTSSQSQQGCYVPVCCKPACLLRARPFLLCPHLLLPVQLLPPGLLRVPLLRPCVLRAPEPSLEALKLTNKDPETAMALASSVTHVNLTSEGPDARPYRCELWVLKAQVEPGVPRGGPGAVPVLGNHVRPSTPSMMLLSPSSPLSPTQVQHPSLSPRIAAKPAEPWGRWHRESDRDRRLQCLDPKPASRQVTLQGELTQVGQCVGWSWGLESPIAQGMAVNDQARENLGMETEPGLSLPGCGRESHLVSSESLEESGHCPL